MNWLINLLVNSLAVIIAAYLLPGVTVTSFVAALLVALGLGVVNVLIRPVLLFLALPVNILTLGLFTLVIDAILILLVAALVPGFRVDGFWWALIFALLLALVGWVLHSLASPAAAA